MTRRARAGSFSGMHWSVGSVSTSSVSTGSGGDDDTSAESIGGEFAADDDGGPFEPVELTMEAFDDLLAAVPGGAARSSGLPPNVGVSYAHVSQPNLTALAHAAPSAGAPAK